MTPQRAVSLQVLSKGPPAFPAFKSPASHGMLDAASLIEYLCSTETDNMDMQTAVKTVLGKYATFTGRAARPEYWWWILATIILFTILAIVDGALIAPMMGAPAFDPEARDPLSAIASLALLLPNLAVGVRRLHDTDRSGWWLLLGLIPIIGSLVLLYFFVQRGTEGSNRFD